MVVLAVSDVATLLRTLVPVPAIGPPTATVTMGAVVLFPHAAASTAIASLVMGWSMARPFCTMRRCCAVSRRAPLAVTPGTATALPAAAPAGVVATLTPAATALVAGTWHVVSGDIITDQAWDQLPEPPGLGPADLYHQTKAE